MIFCAKSTFDSWKHVITRILSSFIFIHLCLHQLWCPTKFIMTMMMIMMIIKWGMMIILSGSSSGSVSGTESSFIICRPWVRRRLRGEWWRTTSSSERKPKPWPSYLWQDYFITIKCCYDILTSKCLFYDKCDDLMAILNFKGKISLFNRFCLSLTPPSVGPCQMSNGQGDLFIIILHINL